MKNHSFFHSTGRITRDGITSAYKVPLKRLHGLTMDNVMPKRRVLLVCSQDLFGDSMESLLLHAEDIELIGSWNLDEGVSTRISETTPDVVVIADKDPSNEKAIHLATVLIEKYPGLSVICAELTQKNFRVFSTRILPARGMDLLEAIHSLPARDSVSIEAARGFSVNNPENLKHDTDQNQRSSS